MVHDMVNSAAYMAHGYCLLWKPWLVVLHAGSDFLIFLAYFAIPVAIWIFLRQRRTWSCEPLAILFAAFIFLCGLTHLVQMVTLWWPIYETQGFLKAATAVVSVITAIMIFPLIPTPSRSRVRAPCRSPTKASSGRSRPTRARCSDCTRPTEQLEQRVDKRRRSSSARKRASKP